MTRAVAATWSLLPPIDVMEAAGWSRAVAAVASWYILPIPGASFISNTSILLFYINIGIM